MPGLRDSEVWTPEKAYGRGPYEVWYLPPYRPEGDRHDYSHPMMRAHFGTDSAPFKEDPITVSEVERTYIRMGSIEANGLEDVWVKMQGESWGRGPASNAYIREVGAQHTSMMMGDVVHDKRTGKWWIADEIGFTELKD